MSDIKTFIVVMTALHGLDAVCGFLNAAAGDNHATGPWVRAISRVASVLVAVWGAWIIGHAF